jgi:hypothetical protein
MDSKYVNKRDFIIYHDLWEYFFLSRCLNIQYLAHVEGVAVEVILLDLQRSNLKLINQTMRDNFIF